MKSLSERAMLVSVSIRQWTARKYDRKETAVLAANHGTEMGLARVNKNLLPGADELVAIEKKTTQIRQLYYDRTLPWLHEGARIIKSAAYMDFVALMRDEMDEWRQLVRKFAYMYPQLQADARRTLNGLYKEEDYPATVADRFEITVGFMPLPDADDFRVDLGDAEMARLRADIKDQLFSAQDTAMKDAWDRVHELVSKTAAKLHEPDAIFRNSLVSNALALCQLLPALNLTDDPKLEEVRRALERSLVGVEPDDLRKDKALRSAVAGDMDDIMRKMGGLYASLGSVAA